MWTNESKNWIGGTRILTFNLFRVEIYLFISIQNYGWCGRCVLKFKMAAVGVIDAININMIDN